MRCPITLERDYAVWDTLANRYRPACTSRTRRVGFGTSNCTLTDSLSCRRGPGVRLVSALMRRAHSQRSFLQAMRELSWLGDHHVAEATRRKQRGA